MASRRDKQASRAGLSGGPKLGLAANLGQFSLLVGINALVGGMVGQERAVLPLLASRVFHLRAFTAILTFLVAFGAVKAATNLVAGALADRVGRKPVLVAGWLFGVRVPALLMWAPSWGWVIAANGLLGVNHQAVAIGVIAATASFGPWMLGTVLLGAGTAPVYPTLLAAVGDVAHPSWRASSVGVYRMWRDAGYVVGALVAGALADWFGLSAAIWAVAVVTFASGTVVAVRMYETSRSEHHFPSA